MFENLKKDDEIEAPKDSVGGSGGNVASALYDATIDMAYMDKSQHGAQGVVLHFKLDEGRFYKQTIWITDRTGKHIWNKGGRKGYMPGFVIFDEMAVLLLGTDASKIPPPENKTIKVYDFTARKELNVEKPVLMAFLGKRIKLGIIEFKEDHYMDTKTWSEKNDINKVFGIDGMTVSEKIAGLGASDFAEKWAEKFAGNVIDKRKESKTGQQFVYQGEGGSAPAGQPAAGAEGTDNAAAPSLFAPAPE